MIKHKSLAATALALVALFAGCKNYATERPDVNQVDLRDRGLQSREVVQASDKMAADLLSSDKLNKSPVKWTIVVMNVDNQTENSRFNLDIFLQRLQAKLASQAPDRIQLIENKEKYHDIQNKEVEGQGPGPIGVQPNYGLYAVITELPNRGTSYYAMNFKITNLQDRTIAWQGMYEVRVAR
jgi:peptidoglycan-synthase activator LpoB